MEFVIVELGVPARSLSVTSKHQFLETLRESTYAQLIEAPTTTFYHRTTDLLNVQHVAWIMENEAVEQICLQQAPKI